jgi:hypothetical protein
MGEIEEALESIEHNSNQDIKKKTLPAETKLTWLSSVNMCTLGMNMCTLGRGKKFLPSPFSTKKLVILIYAPSRRY